MRVQAAFEGMSSAQQDSYLSSWAPVEAAGAPALPPQPPLPGQGDVSAWQGSMYPTHAQPLHAGYNVHPLAQGFAGGPQPQAHAANAPPHGTYNPAEWQQYSEGAGACEALAGVPML